MKPALTPIDLTDNERLALSALVLRAPDRWTEALLSLQRFGLAEQTPYSERAQGEAYWKPRLTDAGRAAFAVLSLSPPRACCEAAVILNCVCSYKRGCAEHGNVCHGSHE